MERPMVIGGGVDSALKMSEGGSSSSSHIIPPHNQFTGKSGSGTSNGGEDWSGGNGGGGGVVLVPSPQCVGREFVRQYYTLLNSSPPHLHRFYSHNSSFVHGGLESGSSGSPATGQRAIHEKIMGLNFRDCHAKIRQVDAHATLDSGVVVQVSGELSNAGGPMRRFMQTFVLAPQSPRKYYVHNDIFRYQDEVFSDEEHEPLGSGVGGGVENISSEEDLKAPKGGVPPPIPDKQQMQQVKCRQPLSDEAPSLNGGEIGPPPAGPTPPTGLKEALPDVTASNNNNNSSNANISSTSSSGGTPTVGLGVGGSSSQSISMSSSNTLTTTTSTTQGPPSSGVALSAAGNNSVSNESSSSSNTTTANNEDIVGDKEDSESGGGGIPGGAEDEEEDLNNEGESSEASSVNNGPLTYAKLVKSGPSSGGPSSLGGGGSGGSSVGGSKFKPGSPSESKDPGLTSSTSSSGGGKGSSSYPRGGGRGGGSLGRGGRERYSSRSDVAPEDLPRSSPRLGSSLNAPGGPFSDSQQLFVGNLPHSVAVGDLYALFGKFGKVIEIRINGRGASLAKTNPSGLLVPNYGFVVFEDEASVAECLKKKPIYLPEGNHRLNIEEKKVNKDLRNMSIPGGRRGGGGGGGFGDSSSSSGSVSRGDILPPSRGGMSGSLRGNPSRIGGSNNSSSRGGRVYSSSSSSSPSGGGQGSQQQHMSGGGTGGNPSSASSSSSSSRGGGPPGAGGTRGGGNYGGRRS